MVFLEHTVEKGFLFKILYIHEMISCKQEQMIVVVIHCHLSKLSVDQTPRLCNLPRKSYSNNISVPYTGGNDLVKESDKPFNGMPIKF